MPVTTARVVAWPTPAALRAACSYIDSSSPSLWDKDLVIALPGGGSVQMAYGQACMGKIVTSCRDLVDGWYQPGWTEPADYDPADLTATIVDPAPAMDALYVWGGSAGASQYNWRGDVLSSYNWRGEDLAVTQGAA